MERNWKKTAKVSLWPLHIYRHTHKYVHIPPNIYINSVFNTREVAVLDLWTPAGNVRVQFQSGIACLGWPHIPQIQATYCQHFRCQSPKDALTIKCSNLLESHTEFRVIYYTFTNLLSKIEHGKSQVREMRRTGMEEVQSSHAFCLL